MLSPLSLKSISKLRFSSGSVSYKSATYVARGTPEPAAPKTPIRVTQSQLTVSPVRVVRLRPHRAGPFAGPKVRITGGAADLKKTQ